MDKAPAHAHVAVLGASPKHTRYSNMAVRLLLEYEYRVTPVHPRFERIEGLASVPTLAGISEPVHTLTLYVGSSRLSDMVGEVLDLQPQRVIFNPGTESRLLQHALDDQGIDWLEGCTLVMLKTASF